MATSGTFYVYEHWRLDKGECFYVGKGSGNRAHVMKGRNKRHKHIVLKLKETGSTFEVKIVASGLLEKEAFALEKERILFWKNQNVNLSNFTDGGEGISGFKHSDETKSRLSEINKRMPAAFKGKKHTEKTKNLLSEIGKKRGAPILSDAVKEKIANFHRGRKRSKETCERISLRAKGRSSPMKGKPSPLKGKSLPLETIEKMRLARQKWWSERKGELQ